MHDRGEGGEINVRLAAQLFRSALELDLHARLIDPAKGKLKSLAATNVVAGYHDAMLCQGVPELFALLNAEDDGPWQEFLIFDSHKLISDPQLCVFFKAVLDAYNASDDNYSIQVQYRFSELCLFLIAASQLSEFDGGDLTVDFDLIDFAHLTQGNFDGCLQLMFNAWLEMDPEGRADAANKILDTVVDNSARVTDDVSRYFITVFLSQLFGVGFAATPKAFGIALEKWLSLRNIFQDDPFGCIDAAKANILNHGLVMECVKRSREDDEDAPSPKRQAMNGVGLMSASAAPVAAFEEAGSQEPSSPALGAVASPGS